ncbi:hypothetical protein [Natribacillus halophilus]|uniref:Uncharacterized protein n=1 Tax=Natribacillus halophilus TaxID=549003 RepID=A0A1G8SN15_9BACI|nr:hypothetical protein [Natribacillus halophilus]SDJ30639.1 hypothetical protein SAMN04488123_1325 [Natribacillus halophilus]
MEWAVWSALGLSGAAFALAFQQSGKIKKLEGKIKELEGLS